ncbi:hypothetical protein T11_7288 [Trichinella zimbabwensis]|uniref:Uncharacterized protein n=1 Tax=Trichinella zimbabwensis TaxID=268475 RepID=A0A0V1F077_9BILA|nr:hypothetical protein T11_7288 [Trichinella zimbabwensis]
MLRERKLTQTVRKSGADPLPEKWKQSQCGENGIGAGKL